MNAGFARSDHVGVGDEVQVATGQGTTELRVSGIVRVNGTDGAGPASLVVFDLATARKLLGVAGYSSVDVLAAPGVLTPGPLARLVTDQVEVVDPRRAVQDDSAGVSDFLGTMAGVLRGFGVLALAVGSFLIFNTLSMLAALRAREFGLLRVVGATPRQLGLLVVSEAAVVGAVASLVGAAVGVGAAAGLLAWLASKDLLPPGLAPQWATLGFALVMGTAVAVAASLPAALRAGRTPPLRTLLDGTARLVPAAGVGRGGRCRRRRRRRAGARRDLDRPRRSDRRRVRAVPRRPGGGASGWSWWAGRTAAPHRPPLGDHRPVGCRERHPRPAAHCGHGGGADRRRGLDRGRRHLRDLVAGRDLRGADRQRARRPHRPARHRRGAGVHL